jgi:hypothetical protein
LIHAAFELLRHVCAAVAYSRELVARAPMVSLRLLDFVLLLAIERRRLAAYR